MNPPFRLGTTSYILPADILANARFLADYVQDVELVLFDLVDGTSNLPDAGTIAALRELAAERDLTYTVHLPLDLRLGEDGMHPSLTKARKVIELTRALDPWAYVAHLDGHAERGLTDPAALARWTDQAARALELVAGWAGGAVHLAVENLETYPLDFWDALLERVPAGRCIDIGHLWLDGHDPLPWLARWLPRARVLHIHGISGHAHRSLCFVPPEELARVLDTLVEADYRGVLTIEAFGEEDFQTSMEALHRWKTGQGSPLDFSVGGSPG
jgi:sugar phosphate isomerase/epimerase